MTRGYLEHLNLLCDMGELTSALMDSHDIQTFLNRTVALVARHLKAEVCSIYLYDEVLNRLFLRATLGLYPESVGSVSLFPEEGLVGRVFSSLAPLCIGNGQKHPDFRYFAQTGEERFLSFLAVPIHRGSLCIGVLVVQHMEADHFGEMDVRALRATASQLASVLENARLLLSLSGEDFLKTAPLSPPIPSLIRAKVASPGYATGSSLIFGVKRRSLLLEDPEAGCSCEPIPFSQAMEKTLADLGALQERFTERLPESASLIFTAHFMMLKDPSFRRRIEEKMGQGLSAMAAVRTVARYYIALFDASPQAYIREKAADMEDVSCRLLENMKPCQDEASIFRPEGSIVIAAELFPSDILKLVSENVAGIVLVSGGLTSHVSILCRSLHIPLLFVEERTLLQLPEGTPLLMDAITGNLYVNPEAEVRETFARSEEARRNTESVVENMAETTCTGDGVGVRLLANINLLSEMRLAKVMKAEGIGLYRSEFPFLIRPAFPSETEQVAIYRKLFEEMPDRVVTIRTLDVGGEKVLAHVNGEEEVNPELGLRSIRFSLLYRDVFEAQIRAILRAASGAASPRIMFPMISSLDEFREAKAIVLSCMAALQKEGLACHVSPQIGMMVELPAAVEIIEEFAKEADFFSIGTNDLVQYMLAVDRSNAQVAHYYQPQHPAVLRALTRVARAGKAAGIDVSVCGEMGHDAAFIPFLLGIGIRTLSLDAQFMPAVQQQILTLKMKEAEEHAERLLALASIREVSSVLGLKG